MKIEELEFQVRGPQIADSDVQRAEQELGVRLPDDYRSFLLLYNGGRSKHYKTSDGLISIVFWESVSERDEPPVHSLIEGNRRIRDKNWRNHIIIGLDLSEKYVVMCISEEQYGAIGLFDWQTEEDVRQTNLPYRSFTAFVERLKPAKMF